jgi:hypothetical protein
VAYTFLQAVRIMHRGRRGHQPSIPSITREWNGMINSEEWRQRYLNTIGKGKIYILLIIDNL